MLFTVSLALVIGLVIAVLMLFQTEVAVLLMLLKMELTEDFRPLKALVTVLFMPFTTEDTVPW